MASAVCGGSAGPASGLISRLLLSDMAGMADMTVRSAADIVSLAASCTTTEQAQCTTTEQAQFAMEVIALPSYTDRKNWCKMSHDSLKLKVCYAAFRILQCKGILTYMSQGLLTSWSYSLPCIHHHLVLLQQFHNKQALCIVLPVECKPTSKQQCTFPVSWVGTNAEECDLYGVQSANYQYWARFCTLS